MKQLGKERVTTRLDGTEKDGLGRDRTDVTRCDSMESRRRTEKK